MQRALPSGRCTRLDATRTHAKNQHDAPAGDLYRLLDRALDTGEPIWFAMTSPAVSPRLTLDEWGALDEDEPGELVDGSIAEEGMPSLVHESAVGWLIAVLRAWLIPRGGFVFGSAAKFAVSTSRGRKPDVTAYLPGGPSLPRRGVVRVPPDIAIEVLSELPGDARRDRIQKPDEYAASGVRRYWIVDPTERTFEFFELGPDARYVRALAAAEGRASPPVATASSSISTSSGPRSIGSNDPRGRGGRAAFRSSSSIATISPPRISARTSPGRPARSA